MCASRRGRQLRSSRIAAPSGKVVGSIHSPRTLMTAQRLGSRAWRSSHWRRKDRQPTPVSSVKSAPSLAPASTSGPARNGVAGLVGSADTPEPARGRVVREVRRAADGFVEPQGEVAPGATRSGGTSPRGRQTRRWAWTCAPRSWCATVGIAGTARVLGQLPAFIGPTIDRGGVRRVATVRAAGGHQIVRRGAAAMSRHAPRWGQQVVEVRRTAQAFAGAARVARPRVHAQAPHP